MTSTATIRIQQTDFEIGHEIAALTKGRMAVGFGMVTYDRGLCSGAAILSRADA